MKRIVLAVIAGFALWSVLWLVVNASSAALAPGAFNEDGTTDSATVLLVVLILSIACSVGSGVLTAAIARTPSLGPAWVLGGLLLAVGVFFQVQYWDAMPLWYHIPFLALLIPGTLIGARFRSNKAADS